MDRKKLAAATAAVVTFIKTQEEAARFSASQDVTMGGLKPVDTRIPVCANTWAMTGRSDQMQGRTMMQMRVFK